MDTGRNPLPRATADILDLAYDSGWRKNEILGLTWEEIDEARGVIRLSPARSKTLVGWILPISLPIADALDRRGHAATLIARWSSTATASPSAAGARRGAPPVRWPGVPTRFRHDCRRTAARTLLRTSVPERVAMRLTGHKSRTIFDRYNIIHEQELLDAGNQLVAYLARGGFGRDRSRAVGRLWA